MTTATSIADLREKVAILRDSLAAVREELNRAEYELIAALRETYPEEWQRWERGIQSVKAEGAEIPLKRDYDMNRLHAEFGEEMPELFELVTPEPYLKADGRKLAQLWKQADFARRLERCLVPQVPRVKVGE